ncbi:hypothetical protein L596_011359 [Steinernema carpocapsae]|uniref:Uncharacterized protein n=1 Tax=Steinernema carpocapsae TaxID=34508 RepID=A0A4U5NUF4_STECR|nr:hypothetical protein L596_011359 [Steinernema carpocapsae]
MTREIRRRNLRKYCVGQKKVSYDQLKKEDALKRIECTFGHSVRFPLYHGINSDAVDKPRKGFAKHRERIDFLCRFTVKSA